LVGERKLRVVLCMTGDITNSWSPLFSRERIYQGQVVATESSFSETVLHITCEDTTPFAFALSVEGNSHFVAGIR